MFRFVPRIAAVLLLVGAGAVAPAAAGERPFHALGEGVVSHDTLYGSGETTHLGHSSLNLYGGGYLDAGLLIPSQARLASASGDLLTFDFDAGIYDIDLETGVVIGTLTFTGGTGRFQDAIGSANVMFEFDPNFYNFRFLIDGSIDY